jgi:hypothetical protein
MSSKPFEHPNNNSPIRKQLAKKIITYYDQLAQSREQDRSRSQSRERSKSRSKSKERFVSSSRVFDSKSGLDKKGEDYEVYEDVEHRRVKLHRLKELMKNELEKSALDGALDPDFETKSKLHPGFPHFMKEEFESVEFTEGDKHHTNVKVHLESKIETFEKPPEEDSINEEEEEEQTLEGENRLYHIVARKSVLSSNKVEENHFDFHQRKAKEIRRLQYAATLASPKKGKTVTKTTITYYAVWVIVSGKPVPAKLASDEGFETNNTKDTLVINEDEAVKVKPKIEHKTKFNKFAGKIKKPVDSEPECDFVVETPEGQRYPILVNLREVSPAYQPPAPVEKEQPVAQMMAERIEKAPVERPVEKAPERAKTRKVEGTNSTILEPKTDKPLGRAKSELVGKDSVTGNKVEFLKAILLDSNNELSVVLLKRLSDKECIIKKSDQTQTIENITSEDIADLDGMTATRLTLQKDEDDKSPFPKEVYMYPNSFFLQPLRIFDNEFISSECENWQDYHGKTEWKKEGPNPEDEKLYILYKDPAGKKDTVRVVLDEAFGKDDISDKYDHLGLLARKRYEEYLLSLKKKRGILELDELRFDVVDRKGRKIKVLIRNDSENEEFSESEGEGEDLQPENAYYHLMVEGNKVTPFKRRTKEQRKAEHEQLWRQRIYKEEEIRKYEVKVDNQVVRSETVEKQLKRKQAEQRIREDLAEIAQQLEIEFPNDKMFDSFVQFMTGLPRGVEEKNAALQYKAMMGQVLSK